MRVSSREVLEMTNRNDLKGPGRRREVRRDPARVSNRLPAQKGFCVGAKERRITITGNGEMHFGAPVSPGDLTGGSPGKHKIPRRLFFQGRVRSLTGGSVPRRRTER